MRGLLYFIKKKITFPEYGPDRLNVKRGFNCFRYGVTIKPWLRSSIWEKCYFLWTADRTRLETDSSSLQKSRFQFCHYKVPNFNELTVEDQKVPGETVMAAPGWALDLKHWLFSLDSPTHNIRSRVLSSIGVMWVLVEEEKVWDGVLR